MTTRYEHFLTPVNGNKLPSGIVVVECNAEVRVERPGPAIETEALRYWTAYSCYAKGKEYGRELVSTSSNVQDFWDGVFRLLRRSPNLWIFTSCAPQAWALLELWRMLEEGELVLNGIQQTGKDAGAWQRGPQRGAMVVLEDPVNAVQVRRVDDPGTIVLCDLRNYGVDTRDTAGRTEARARRGFDFVLQMVEALRAAELGNLCVTAASQAYHTFRHSFLNHSLLVHNHKEALELEDRAYVGGRSECYIIGDVRETVYHLDVSSMYGSIMRDALLPVCLQAYEEFVIPVDKRGGAQMAMDIAEVYLSTPQPAYPFRKGEFTYYPVGELWTTLCGDELRHAEWNGHVVKYRRGAWYAKRKCCVRFAEFFLARIADCKRESFHDLGRWCKRILVGLAGKFGQRGKEWIDEPQRKPDHEYDSWIEPTPDGGLIRYRAIAGHVQREVQSLWGTHAVPSVASHITAAGRNILWRAMQCSGLDNTFYCDTDSLFVNELGMANLSAGGWIAADSPGKLRVVEECAGASFRGFKSYTAGSKEVNSGVPKGTLDPYSPRGYYWFRTFLAEAYKTHDRPQSIRKLHRYVGGRAYKQAKVLEGGTCVPFRLPSELGLMRETYG